MKTIKHCKKQYEIIENYSSITNLQTIKVNNKLYVIERLPRPTTTESELMCVFVKGIKYNSLAKFLKSVS